MQPVKYKEYAKSLWKDEKKENVKLNCPSWHAHINKWFKYACLQKYLILKLLQLYEIIFEKRMEVFLFIILTFPI